MKVTAKPAHACQPQDQAPVMPERQKLGGADVHFKDGKLTVTGSKHADDIQVERLGAGKVKLTVNGSERTYEGVNAVKVRGGRGSDTITAQDSFEKGDSARQGAGHPLKLKIKGGRGDDEINNNFDYARLLGGRGDDTITSSGNDTRLRGQRGNDVLIDSGIRANLRGGRGDDLAVTDGTAARVHLGHGKDSAVNTDAAARIDGGPGRDRVLDTTGTARIRRALRSDDI